MDFCPFFSCEKCLWHTWMPQQIRKREKEKLVNAEINANNAIYLLKTNKNIDKLCETKEVFSNYLNLKSNIGILIWYVAI